MEAAELLPSKTTIRMFSNGADYSYNVASGTEHVISITEIGMWLVTIKFYGANVEHMSSYIFSNAGIYAKYLTKLSGYDFNPATSSVSVKTNVNGSHGLLITATYTSLFGLINVIARRLV